MQSWHQTRNELALVGLGRADLLDASMTAFFSSRQCPGIAIRAAMDWALLQARAKTVVISGFHSPLEQSVLKVLMQARSPVVVVLARSVTTAKLSSEWLTAIDKNLMTVVSVSPNTSRLTRKIAMRRNDLVAELASDIVVAHMNPTGEFAGRCETWMAEKAIQFLYSPLEQSHRM